MMNTITDIAMTMKEREERIAVTKSEKNPYSIT